MKATNKRKTMILAAVMTATTTGVFAAGLDNTVNPTAAHYGAEAYGYTNEITETGRSAFAVGYNNTVSANNALAYGVGNKAEGINSLVGGEYSHAKGRNSVAIGSSAQALQDNTFAIGSQARTNGEDALAFGNGAYAENQATIAVGESARAKGLMGTAVGYGTRATADYTTAVGYQNAVTGQQSSAIGVNNETTGQFASAVGTNNETNGSYAFAAGFKSKAVADNSIAVGNQAEASGEHGLAIGTIANATATDAVAVGHSANATGKYSIAIGSNTSVSVAESVAIGNNSKAESVVGTSSTNIGNTTYNFAGSTPVGTVSIGDANKERTLTNLAAGRINSMSTDAINGSQLHAVITEMESKNQNTLSQANHYTDTQVNKGVAKASALAGLKYLDYNPKDKWSFAASVGHYRNANAVAVGMAYQPNENTMVHGGITVDGKVAYNLGVSVKVGGQKYINKYELVEQVRQLQSDNAELRQELNELRSLIGK